MSKDIPDPPHVNLWCSRCHTCWTEAVLLPGDNCPFKDCGGWLTEQRPATLRPKPDRRKVPATFPLFDDT
jgi:hypothetical protein